MCWLPHIPSGWPIPGGTTAGATRRPGAAPWAARSGGPWRGRGTAHRSGHAPGRVPPHMQGPARQPPPPPRPPAPQECAGSGGLPAGRLGLAGLGPHSARAAAAPHARHHQRAALRTRRRRAGAAPAPVLASPGVGGPGGEQLAAALWLAAASKELAAMQRRAWWLAGSVALVGAGGAAGEAGRGRAISLGRQLLSPAPRAPQAPLHKASAHQPGVAPAALAPPAPPGSLRPFHPSTPTPPPGRAAAGRPRQHLHGCAHHVRAAAGGVRRHAARAAGGGARGGRGAAAGRQRLLGLPAAHHGPLAAAQRRAAARALRHDGGRHGAVQPSAGGPLLGAPGCARQAGAAQGARAPARWAARNRPGSAAIRAQDPAPQPPACRASRHQQQAPPLAAELQAPPKQNNHPALFNCRASAGRAPWACRCPA
jgi:hypothetical protein